jgi:hypothetical protein
MLRRRNISPNEFELSGTPWRIDAEQAGSTTIVNGPVVSAVTVRSCKTGIERTYTDRNYIGPSPYVGWVNDAASDVDAGLFG